MRILGIDPGAKGALAIVEGPRLEIFDMPRLGVSRGKSVKDEIDGYSLWSLLSDLSYDVAYIELVGGQDGQSAPAAFNFGRAAGAPEYLLIAAGKRFERVPPVRWKSALRLRSGKDDARAMAMRLFPAAALELRKRRPDFSEAALIAEYGRRQEDRNVFD